MNGNRLTWLIVGIGVCCALLQVRCAQAQEPSPPHLSFRIRFEWGSQTLRDWQGLLEISDGQVRDFRSLGGEADDAGSLWSDGNAVWFTRRTPRIYDGFDVSVTAPATAVLNLTLQSKGLHEQFEARVADICESPSVFSFADEEGRLVISRTPGDSVFINVDRPHLVYTPGESFVARVRLNAIGRTTETFSGDFSWSVHDARSLKPLNRGSRPATIQSNTQVPVTMSVTVPLPDNEGVYDIRFRFSADGLPLLQSSAQVAVVSATADFPDQADLRDRPENLVDNFVPKDVSSSRIVGSRPPSRLTGHTLELTLKSLSRVLPRLSLGTETEQETKAEPEKNVPHDVTWEAYRLHVRHPGQPHRLIVSLPTLPSQHRLGVSLLEPNAAGQLMPLSIDSGVLAGSDLPRLGIPENETASTSPFEHEILFWPKTASPILFIHDLALGEPITVDQVQLFELIGPEPADGEIPPLLAIGDAHESATPPRTIGTDADANFRLQQRLIGPYMRKPMFPENLGAREVRDEATERSLDDWVTFLTAGQRLVQYLKTQGFNSITMGVFVDGSGIYPSEHLEMTPRYDTGVYSSNGQDLARKDVLELLFRLFDRESLVFVPELQFSTPLPALERILRQPGSSSSAGKNDRTSDGYSQNSRGIELIGHDGRSWREVHSSVRGHAPYYNPLDPRVQNAVVDIVREIVERYASHDSFQALSIEVSTDSYMQFPGLKWGYDDGTMVRFERDTEIRLPDPCRAGDDRFRHRYDFLTSDAKREWIQWRCREIAKFHKRICEVVTTAKPSTRCLFAANRAVRSNALESDVREVVRSGGRLEPLLLACGLEFRQYSEVDRCVVLRPSLWNAAQPMLERAADATLNTSPVLDRLFSGTQQGSLFYHVPCELRVTGFDSVAPWQPAFTWLAVHMSPGGVSNRQRFAHALAAYDSSILFDGGWMIPLGQERVLRPLVETVREIPAIPFQADENQQQPAVVRVARDRGNTYIYVVNDFSGPTDVRLVLACPSDSVVRELGASRAIRLGRDHSSSRTINIAMEPFDIWACEINSTNARLVSVQANVDHNALRQLKTRVEAFEHKMADLQQSQEVVQVALDDPGFETKRIAHAGGTRPAMPDWEIPVQPAAFWSYDENRPHSGDSALLVEATDAPVSLASAPIPLTNQRFLSMQLWLRSDAEDSHVRLSFEGETERETQTRSADISVDAEWRPYVFRVHDIPVDQIAYARIGITVLEPCRVWIDDVDMRLHHVSSDDVRQLTKTFASVALAWEEERYADCARLLDGYWGQYLFQVPASDATENPIPAPLPQPSVGKKIRNILDKYRIR